MNNKELTNELARRLGYENQDAAQLVNSMVTMMSEQLQEGKTLVLADFGTFEVKKELERIEVNPLTKQRFLVPPKLVLTFKPAAAFKEKLKNTPWKVFSRLTGFFCKDIAYIKRVVGMPGDKFEIKSDNTGKYTVYINDKPLDEPYIQSPYDYTPCTEAMMCGPAVIPEGHYLMLGDNRGNSQDGRYWGLLPQDRFIGRAVFVFWPFSRAKTLH